MRIAQIAALAESVPPKLYGGTARVVAWLVDELVEFGHDVTLFASAIPGRVESCMRCGRAFMRISTGCTCRPARVCEHLVTPASPLVP